MHCKGHVEVTHRSGKADICKQSAQCRSGSPFQASWVPVDEKLNPLGLTFIIINIVLIAMASLGCSEHLMS